VTALRVHSRTPVEPAAPGPAPLGPLPRRRRLADALALLALLALVAWQLWPAAGPGRLPQNLDLMLQYVPNVAYLQRSLVAGRVPLWNPYLGAGMPFAADPGAGVWYLPNWLPLLLLPLDAAVRVILWAHLAWGAAGTYLFLRRVGGVGPAPAWIGAAAFGLTTWLPGLAGMPVVLGAVAWLPWILLLGDLALRRGSRWTVPLALAGALQAVAGWPAGAYLAWLTLTALILLRPAREWTRAALRLAGAGALAALLAGVLLVPAAELIAQTSYAETRAIEQVAADGYLTLLSWLRPASGAGALESSQLYLGMTPFLLALAALATVRRRIVLVAGAVALIALLLASGTHGPLFAPVYHFLPGFRIVYLPARLGIVAGFALAALAALGAQRVTAGRWRWRDAAAVAALAAGAGLVVLLQFWHSEGYDNFRRLLTNVGRFAGGPFLTREQETHYLVFGLLGLAAVFAAVRLPARLSAALLLALTAADLGIAQWQSRPPGFDPVDWYGRATAAATREAPAEGMRLAGLQWHGRSHMLADFPRSADPDRLPPNLSLLAGVHDAQGYNPLLLRRAVDYFSGINGGRRDDHWLLIGDVRSSLVDDLAVQRILIDPAPGEAAGRDGPGETWRLAQPLLREGMALPANGAAVELWRAPAGALPAGAGRLFAVTYLGEATSVAQATPAIELEIRGRGPAGPEARRATLRAGAETAEWAYGRPDVRAAAAHGQAPVALETRLVGAVSGAYSVYEYLAAVDLTGLEVVDSVAARSLLPGVGAYVQGLSLAPVPDGRYRLEEGAAVNGAARPRASLGGEEGGAVTWTLDRPERIVLRTNATRAAALVLADSYYPGWTATVDGAAAPVRPAEGLFRGVDLEPGPHEVVFLYRPPSLLLGAVATLLGLVIAAITVALPRFHPPRPILRK
jgi:hypothetical protein